MTSLRDAPPDIAALLLLAILLDAAIGDPPWLYRRVPHPVVLMGRLVELFDRRWNDESATPGQRRLAGAAAIMVVLALVGLAGWLLLEATRSLPYGWILEALLMSTLLAQNSLYRHVADVAAGLRTGGLAAGRSAVRRIVGRDPESLDEPGVARAALESLAENFSDGVVAPLFWGLLLGLPGMLAYKAINTADSMIGHRTPRHRDFGQAAARLDDAVNLIPARLAGILLAAAALASPGGSPGRGLAAMWSDAPRHRSPNAGWPEAALAGALGLALAGPRRYGSLAVGDAWMGRHGRREASADDIRRGLRVYLAACVVTAALVAGLAVLQAAM